VSSQAYFFKRAIVFNIYITGALHLAYCEIVNATNICGATHLLVQKETEP